MIILQTYNDNPLSGLLLVLAIIGICVALFLVFRTLVLWYWKVDVIVNNQQKQIVLLHDIVTALKKDSTDKTEKFTT